MTENSIDKVINRTYSGQEVGAAQDQLLGLAVRFHGEAISDPFAWAQSVALMLQCELNRVCK